jgi:hypothetical protein
MAFLPILALAATVISAVGAVAGGISQMNAANAAADYEKKAAAENARRQKIDAQKQIGRVRANYGASGVTMEGSPLDVLEESARTAELDRLTILQGGKLRAQQYKARGQDALIGGITSAAGTLLGGSLDFFEGQQSMKATG